MTRRQVAPGLPVDRRFADRLIYAHGAVPGEQGGQRLGFSPVEHASSLACRTIKASPRLTLGKPPTYRA
jgi:hypothetical protein